LRCSLDAILADGAILEAKCPRPVGWDRVAAAGLPPRWQIQVQHQLLASGRTDAWVVVYHPVTARVLTLRVEPLPAVQDAIRAAVAAFWRAHVVPRVPPTLWAAPTAAPALPAGEGRYLAVTGQAWLDAAHAYAAAEAQAREADARKDDLRAQIASVMEACGIEAADIGGHRFAFDHPGPRVSLDRAALAAAHPDLDLAPFTRTTQPRRGLRYTPPGGRRRSKEP
jgi:hypothetical protein